MGGSPPISASLSGSSSATAGLSGNFSNIFGDVIVGKKTPWWLWPSILGVVLLLGGAYIVRKF